MVSIPIVIRRKKAANPVNRIVCGNKDYQVVFDFDAEWLDYPVKTARFIYAGQFTDVVFEGNTCQVPLLQGVDMVAVGVFAGDLITSTPAVIGCDRSILCDEGAPAEPSPDVYAQIMELLNSGGVPGGGGTGKPGTDGITPHIGENGNWYIGETDTGVKAQGKDGKDGDPGTPGKDGDDYVLTDTDKTEIAEQAAQMVIDDAPVKSVNGKTGAVKLAASDVGARPSTWTPSATDVGADPKGTANTAISTHNVSTDAHNDLRLLIDGLTSRLNALANSTDEDLDQMAEMVAYIKENRELISGITTNKVNVADIINNLTTNVSNKPLSAAQGVALKALIDALDNGKLNASELTTAINTALAQAKASGEFKGEKGDKGDKGDPYTLTSTDKSAIVNAVIAALPVYNGEVS